MFICRYCNSIANSPTSPTLAANDNICIDCKQEVQRMREDNTPDSNIDVDDHYKLPPDYFLKMNEASPIELSSREPTPNSLSNDTPSSDAKLPQNAKKEDEEDVVLVKISKKRKRRDSEFNIVCTLNLLSEEEDESDASVEVIVESPPAKTLRSNEKQSISNQITNGMSSTAPNPPIASNGVDADKQPLNCAVCSALFKSQEALIQHMRSEHPTYKGKILSVRPKLPHDSPMTTRLCYLSKQIYYECQRCGHLDKIMREHKAHITSQHSPKSMELRSAATTSQQCPICEEKCGQKKQQLCEHLRLKHADAHAEHLKQIKIVRPVDCSKAKHTQVVKTAKVFQFATDNKHYFECQRCHRISSSYTLHWQHVLAHKKKDTEAKQKASRKEKTEKIKKQKDQVKQNKCQKNGNVQTQPKIKAENDEIPAAPRKKRVYKKTKQVACTWNLQLECRFCGMEFSGLIPHNEHLLQQHAANETFSCSDCCAIYFNVQSLLLHRKEKHEGVDPPLRSRKSKAPGKPKQTVPENCSPASSELDENCNRNSRLNAETLINGTQQQPQETAKELLLKAVQRENKKCILQEDNNVLQQS